MREPVEFHVLQRVFAQNIVLGSRTQKLQEVDPALGARAFEPGKSLPRNDGAKTIFSIMAGSRIVCLNVRRDGQPLNQ